MKTLGLLMALLWVASCQSDTRNLEHKIDELNKKVDLLVAGGGARGGRGPERPSRPAPDAAKTYAVPIDGDAFEGPADAKVTLVKAYDYACPYCEKVRTTMDDLRKKYGNDLRIVYKQFVVHPQTATVSALAFCAAARQGKAAPMNNLLWDKGFKARNFDKDAEGGGPPQKCWDSAAGCPIAIGFAQELKLDVPKFKTDMKDCQQLIQKDMRDLQQFGVAATPSFFINGRFMSGASPIETFSALIDDELKKANERIQQGASAAEYYKQWVLDKGLKSLEVPKG
jgi:protein-disulfide isomerase